MVILLPQVCHSVRRVPSVNGRRGNNNRPAYVWHLSCSVCTRRGRGELVEYLQDAMSRANYRSNKGTYLFWVMYFNDGAGKKSTCQLATFFAYWLTHFVFPSPPDDWFNLFVFPMAALLAPRNPIALGPWFLGSLFRRPDECVHNVVRSVGR